MIRGANPQPGAWSLYSGNKTQIFDCKMSEEGSGKPGEVIGIDDDSFTVAANGGAILVKRVRSEKDKMLANEFVSHFALKVGDRFGS